MFNSCRGLAGRRYLDLSDSKLLVNWRNSSCKVENDKTHKIISRPGTPVFRISVEISECKKGLKSKSFFQLMDFVCQWDWYPYTRGHKFNYYVGKQALCQNFLQNIFKAGCEIHRGVFLNKLSNLHITHPLLVLRKSSDHHDFICLNLVTGDIIHGFDRIAHNLGQ